MKFDDLPPNGEHLNRLGTTTVCYLYKLCGDSPFQNLRWPYLLQSASSHQNVHFLVFSNTQRIQGVRFDRLDMFKVVHPTLKRCQYGKQFNLYPKQFRPIRSFMVLYGYLYHVSFWSAVGWCHSRNQISMWLGTVCWWCSPRISLRYNVGKKNNIALIRSSNETLSGTPGKLTWQMEKQPWTKMYLVLKMVIFQCHASFQWWKP